MGKIDAKMPGKTTREEDRPATGSAAIPQVPAGHPEKPEGEDGFKLLECMNGGHHEELSLWGLQFLELAPDAHVLEIGCGGGANIARLLERAPQGRVAGVDVSAVSVEASRNHNAAAIEAGRCQVVEGNSSALPFPEGTFDAATAFETVYYWDLAQAFAEVRRVLKPGGLFLICNEDDGLDEGMHEFAKQVPTMVIYTAEELSAALEQAGFSIQVAQSVPEKGHLALVARKPSS